MRFQSHPLPPQFLAINGEGCHFPPKCWTLSFPLSLNVRFPCRNLKPLMWNWTKQSDCIGKKIPYTWIFVHHTAKLDQRKCKLYIVQTMQIIESDSRRIQRRPSTIRTKVCSKFLRLVAFWWPFVLARRKESNQRTRTIWPFKMKQKRDIAGV